MLCKICNCNEATIILKKVVGNKEEKIHLCMKCAKKIQMLTLMQETKKNNNANLNDDHEKVVKEKIVCQNCGYTNEEFINTGKVGCTKCYEYLKNDILDWLIKNDKDNGLQYYGYFPSTYFGIYDKMLLLKNYKRKLKIAIRSENFDEAAKLRDLIKELEADDKIK